MQGAIARRAVDAWLTGLSPDTDLNDRESRERFRWANDGWEVEFSAIPIPREHRGRPDHRPIGIYADGEAGVIDDAPSIRSALDSKASAYGALDRPLILAAGTFIWDHDKQHSSNATFGHLAVQAWEDEGGVRHRQSIRRPDGFFGAPPDWSHRDVSAVLHVNQLQPSHFQGAEVTLWHHPAATLPLPIDIGIPAQIMRLDGTEMWEVDSAVEAVEHFEVPAVWPVGDAFPDRVDGTSGSEER